MTEFENLLAQLPQVPERDETKYFWLEDAENLTPATDAEMRDGLNAAMAEAREKGWIPKDDPGCECLTCRSFRSYLART